MKVVTLLDETLRFISLQTKKCHVQHTTRMARYAEQTLCGMPIHSDAIIRPKRAISDVCGRCTNVLNAYYTGVHGREVRAKIEDIDAVLANAKVEPPAVENARSSH